MKLDQIKKLVDAGETVHWGNFGYIVIKDKLGQYFVHYKGGDYYVGLTNQAGELEGSEQSYFIAEPNATMVVLLRNQKSAYKDRAVAFYATAVEHFHDRVEVAAPTNFNIIPLHGDCWSFGSEEFEFLKVYPIALLPSMINEYKLEII